MSKSTPSISIQYPLAFDIVKTNNGNGYHASTGVFIAPAQEFMCLLGPSENIAIVGIQLS